MAETKEKKKGTDMRIAFLAVAALALVAIGALFFTGGSDTPAPPINNGTVGGDEAATLLLSTFDKQAALGAYSMRYQSDEGGEEVVHEIISNGNAAWFRESGAFGSREGFFGPNNETDVLCLNYSGERKCATVGNSSDMLDIAMGLKSFIPTKGVALAQKSVYQKHIDAGAIKFVGGIDNEAVGGFDTRKITYMLDYRNLTVQELVSLGISPSDPMLYTTTDYKVQYWVDVKSGMVIKSLATYKDGGVPYRYGREYGLLETDGPQALPELPSTSDQHSFARFYAESAQDYSEKMACAQSPAGERGACYKNLAIAKNDWGTCKLIEDQKDYETCTLVVAQNTRNKVLCEKLQLLSDDCNIAVASVTGNFDLCHNLKDTGLLKNCSDAAVEGAKKKAEEETALQKFYENRNCEADAGCKIVGNANQYCVASNDTRAYADDNSPLTACFKGVKCGCLDGYCGFAKNDTYYACVSDIEEEQLREYIEQLVKGSNSTNGSAGIG